MLRRSPARFLSSRVLLLALLLLAVPNVALAAESEGLANVDVRADGPDAAVPAITLDARAALEDDLGRLGEVRTAATSGGIEWIASPGALLTGPSDASPESIALAYVREHRIAFGLEDSDIDTLRLVARSVDPQGITHLRYNQVLSGFESFDHGIEAHVTRDGSLVSISGAPMSVSHLADTLAQLKPVAALAAARDAVDGSGVPTTVDSAAAPGAPITFTSGERARLRWTSTPTGVRLVWNVITDGVDGHAYDVLVDADTGALVRRNDLTHALGEANFFPRSPSAMPSVQVTMPPAWIDDTASGTRLWGQFSRTYVDPAPDTQNAAPGLEIGGTRRQVPASGGAPAAPDWLYAQSVNFPGATPCPLLGCTWNPLSAVTSQTNERQAAVNVHVLTSRFHDHLARAPIGFDEASGNFQRTNTSGQGLGNDYVRSEVNDGSGTNNANFATFPDGIPPRMQMYLFTSPAVNGSDVADIVYHEYGHGLSNRLIVNASGASTIASLQPRMMGEAWSDFYAMDLLQAEGNITDTPANGEVRTGEEVTVGGIRAKPLDCPVDTDGTTVACNGNSTATEVKGGYTYGDIARTNNNSPHGGSTVWAQTLWDIRSVLGRDAALALVTGGMRLSPDNPSMLDMRDSILLQAVAMRSAPGASDDHYGALWSIFAQRGFGASASTTNSNSVAPVESYDLPIGVRLEGTTLVDPYPGGDADGVVEPGEQVRIDQLVRGIGPADLAPVAGTLGAPNGLSIVDGTAAWPVLGRGRAAVNVDPLVVMTSSCTAPASVAITVTSPEGNATKTVKVDARPASRQVVPLVDNGVKAATFVVPTGGTITDLDLRIDELRHTWLGDLRITLTHGATTAVVYDPVDANFAGDDLIELVIDDEAAAKPGESGAGPITGRFRAPALNALSVFDGQDAAGTWTLTMTDGFPGDTGELRGWGLDRAGAACPRAEIPGADTGDASSLGTAGATISGSVTPNGRATGIRFSYGATSAYGATTPTLDIGAGDAPFENAVALAGLAPSTTYHYRVEAIREGGVVAVVGADRTFTTAAVPAAQRVDTPPPASDRTAPAFVGPVTVKLGAKVRKQRAPTYSFRLSEAAKLAVTLTRSAPGIKSGRACIAPPRVRPANAKPCVRQVPVPAGTKSQSYAAAGPGKLLTHVGARLSLGSYTATFTATDAAKNRSAAKVVKFIVT